MRTITVKGTGNVSVKPDLIVVSMILQSVDKDYQKAMNIASDKINAITESLVKVGFDKTAVKTTSFNVEMRYDNVRDNQGTYIRQFSGYAVVHRLKVEFDFDTAKLSNALKAVSDSKAQPELDIAFTVKDTNAVNQQLLVSATQNAFTKAQTLCQASGVKLGTLASIDYSWDNQKLMSPTRYAVADECMTLMKANAVVDFQPDDIKVKDNVTFVWEIL